MTAEWHLPFAYRSADATRADVRVAELAGDQWGVVDLEDLRRCGLSDQAVLRRVRAGHLHPLYQRVFAVGHTHLTQQALILAAVMACGPTAVASHHSSGELFLIVRLGDRRPDLTVPGVTTRRHPGIRVHRTTRLDPRDVTRRHGIPTTTPARTLV